MPNQQERFIALQQKLQQANIDQFLLTDPTSIDYLIGHRFHPGERFLALLINQETKPLLFLNRLFPTPPNNHEHHYQTIALNDGDDIIAILDQYIAKTKPLAIDNHLTASIVLPLQQITPLQLGSHLIEELRLIKDTHEQQALRNASKRNDQVMKEVEAALQIGVLDTDIEATIYAIYRRLGVTPSFPPIVAFAHIASDPHGSANGQVLQEHDCVIIDMGLVLDNYCSDMTRTFLFGRSQMKDIYEIVKQANLAAIASIRPGVRFCDVDKAARDVITQAGYGDYFTHRTGHGIGLDVHEPMDVSRVNEEILKEGMCFSIEPGIYLPGVGGVRIEDLVLVTSNGVEVLNHYPK